MLLRVSLFVLDYFILLFGRSISLEAILTYWEEGNVIFFCCEGYGDMFKVPILGMNGVFDTNGDAIWWTNEVVGGEDK